VKHSVKDLSNFLSAINEIKTTNHILGHSMGARLLWKALHVLPRQNNKFGNIFWMASDVRKDTFRKYYSNRVSPHCNRSTNYFCKKDAALEYSRKLCGYHKRLGAGSAKVLDNINVKIPSSMAKGEDSEHRHTYFTANPILNDIFLQILTSRTPEARGLKFRKNKGYKL